MAMGGDDAESKLMQKVKEYESMARRSDAARATMQRDFDHLTAQVAYYKNNKTGGEIDDGILKKTGPTVAEKIETLKTRKETKALLKQAKEEAPSDVTQRPAHCKDYLRQRYLKSMYKTANSSPIPLQTSVGTAHLSQAAYLRKLANSKTKRDGTMTVEGTVDNQMEALIALTKQTDAEKFLHKIRGAGGIAPQRLTTKYMLFTTTFANDVATSKTEKIKAIFKARQIIFTEIDLNEEPDRRQEMADLSGDRDTLPQIFINGKYLSDGCEELQQMHDNNELEGNTI